jgi:putative component of membrane protein insertase Oxa1/YidC/SpoIIIJ protein YidD
MLVQVKWKNGTYDYVRDFMLDHLIEVGVVDSFLRCSGWVTIGVDPVRSNTSKSEYHGPERRSIGSISAGE